jgi:site-specific DNA-methyltransferase (adenine-specific)
LNQILTGDCIDHLSHFPASTVDLAFADPPFNSGTRYDVYLDHLTRPDYLEWTRSWLQAVHRVLKPTASVYVAISDEYAAEMKLALDGLGLTMRNWIIWHYTFGTHCQKKFNRSHTHVFYYVMDPDTFTFNVDQIRVPSARQTTYGDKRAHAKGKTPDDVWVLRPQESSAPSLAPSTGASCPLWVLRPQEDPTTFQPDTDTWFTSRVCGTFSERLQHPCQMPEAILERIIKVSSNPGDLVLDPFAGSGTTLAVAKRLQRHYLGIEVSPHYVRQIEQRLS